MWKKAKNIRRQVRFEFSNNGQLIKLANHYNT